MELSNDKIISYINQINGNKNTVEHLVYTIEYLKKILKREKQADLIRYEVIDSLNQRSNNQEIDFEHYYIMVLFIKHMIYKNVPAYLAIERLNKIKWMIENKN